MSAARALLKQQPLHRATTASAPPTLKMLAAHSTRSVATGAAPQSSPEHLSTFQYFRKYCWAPEAAPLVAIISIVLGLAGTFAWNGAKSSDVAWRPRKGEYPWLKVSTDQAHLESTPAYVAPPEEDKTFHGERVLERKSFKVPRW